MFMRKKVAMLKKVARGESALVPMRWLRRLARQKLIILSSDFVSVTAAGQAIIDAD